MPRGGGKTLPHLALRIDGLASWDACQAAGCLAFTKTKRPACASAMTIATGDCSSTVTRRWWVVCRAPRYRWLGDSPAPLRQEPQDGKVAAVRP